MIVSLSSSAAFALGAAFGSFLNVCIVRLPADESVVRPGSRCPRCKNPVRWYDNIPILSWIILRARCRYCREPISFQYPLIELLVGLIWAASVVHYGLSLTAATAAVFGTLLLGIGVTDARHYLIPDEYTWGGLLAGLLLALAAGLGPLLDAAIGAAVGFTLLYAVAVLGEKAFGKEAMGGGDIKMMAMVGAFVGWKGVLLTIFGGALIGTVVFVPIHLKTRKLVPFGVFLAAAAAITFVMGDAIVAWYVREILNG